MYIDTTIIFLSLFCVSAYTSARGVPTPYAPPALGWPSSIDRRLLHLAPYHQTAPLGGDTSAAVYSAICSQLLTGSAAAVHAGFALPSSLTLPTGSGDSAGPPHYGLGRNVSPTSGGPEHYTGAYNCNRGVTRYHPYLPYSSSSNVMR